MKIFKYVVMFALLTLTFSFCASNKTSNNVEITEKPKQVANKKSAKKNKTFAAKKQVPKKNLHYVDKIKNKLNLTETQRERLYLVFKTYHFKLQYAENDEEHQRLKDMQQEAFQNIVGYEKYKKFLELRNEGLLD